MFLPSALAHACTVCDSPTGHAVCAGLFNGHFLQTLLLVLLPFPVLAMTVFLFGLAMPDLAQPESARPRLQEACPELPL